MNEMTPVTTSIAAYRQGKLLLLLDDRAEKLETAQLLLPLHAAASAEMVKFKQLTASAIEAYTSLTTNPLLEQLSVGSKQIKPIVLAPEPQAWPARLLQRPCLATAALVLADLAEQQTEFFLGQLQVSSLPAMAMVEDVMALAQQQQLALLRLSELVNYIKQQAMLVTMAASSKLPTKQGDFQIYVYENQLDFANHVAIVKGDVSGKDNVLVRIHSECLTGDVFGSQRCDCGEQLEYALAAIEQQGCGVVIYMRQEGRGIGIVNKIKAYALQEQGFDTVQANEELGLPVDAREYVLSAHILRQLGVNTINLLTNNPTKLQELANYGIDVRQRVAIEMPRNCNNHAYLETKRHKMGHLISKLPRN